MELSAHSGGGSKVRRPVNQLSWEGPVQNYVILKGISEQPDLKRGFKKLGGFHNYRMDVYTHTFMFKQLEK